MSIKIKRLLINSIVIVTFLSIAGIIVEIEWKDPFVGVFFDIVEYIIYLWLLTFWGASIGRRITNRIIRDSLFSTDLFLIIWLLARSLKYYAFDNRHLSNLMWYMYYSCMLAVLVCFFITTDCMVNKNRARRVNNAFFVGIPSLCFSILVLTNDYHKYVFFLDENYESAGYNIGFFAIVLWIIAIVLISVVRIRINFDEVEYRKKYILPISVIILTVVYLFLYYFDIKPFSKLEFTIVLCAMIIGFIESIIYAGFIPSNVEYEWCFSHSGVNSRILNMNGDTIYKSINSIPIVKEEFEELITERTVHHDAGTDFCMAPIRGGYAVWENDVRNINELIARLKETETSISEATETLRENIVLEKRRKKADERIRLYDTMFAGVKDTITALEKLLAMAEGETGKDLYDLMVRIDILGVFLKRKSNLILLNEQNLGDYAKELELCFKESFDNLVDAGIGGRFVFNKVSRLDNLTAIRVYEAFDSFVEYLLDDMESINAILIGGDKSCILTMNAECRNPHTAEELKGNLLRSSDVLPDIENEGTECTVSFCIFRREGGK